MLSGSLLACCLLLAAPDGVPEDVMYWNTTKFQIPVNLAVPGKDIKELVLYVSRDEGQNWQRLPPITPDKQHFPYVAQYQGMHWFAIQTVFKGGTMQPQAINPTTPPSLKIVVDTIKPDIRLNAERNGDKIAVQWEITEPNPEKASLRLDYQIGEMGMVTPQGIIINRTGNTEIPCPSPSPVRVQMALKDKAGNVGKAEVIVPAAAAGAVPPWNGNGGGEEKRVSRLMPGGADLGPRTEPMPPPPPREPTAIVSPGSSPGPTGFQPFRTEQGGVPATAGLQAPSGPVGLLSGSLPQVFYVSKGHIKAEFDVTRCGPSGVGTADVYLTFDDGHTWEKTQPDEPVLLPGGEPAPGVPAHASVIVNIPREEVIFGIFLVVKSKAGVSIPPPQKGTIPQMRVELDGKSPEAVLKAPQPVGDGVVVFTWTAHDRNLATNPITLEYADTPNGPWKVIGQPALPNNGRYDWQVPGDAPPKAHIRMIIRDQAGNVSVAQFKTEVTLDTTAPIIGPVTIRAGL